MVVTDGEVEDALGNPVVELVELAPVSIAWADGFGECLQSPVFVRSNLNRSGWLVVEPVEDAFDGLVGVESAHVNGCFNR